MSGISSHVLDTALGTPASGLSVSLSVWRDGRFEAVSQHMTNAQGRVPDLLAGATLEANTYRLVFDTGAYFAAAQRPAFYPSVEVVFCVQAPAEHYHVPLLLSPFGYSTYRGS